MNSWTYHGKPTKNRRNRRGHRDQRGHGSYSPVDHEPEDGLVLDERSGLYLPEHVTQDRRKSEIGFGRKDAA